MVLIIVCDVFESVLGESISVKAFVLCCDPIDSLIEWQTAEVGLNDLQDSGLIFFGDVILISGNEGIYIYASGSACIVFVTHSLILSVNGHSNPLNSGVTLGNGNSVLRMREERL